MEKSESPECGCGCEAKSVTGASQASSKTSVHILTELKKYEVGHIDDFSTPVRMSLNVPCRPCWQTHESERNASEAPKKLAGWHGSAACNTPPDRGLPCRV